MSLFSYGCTGVRIVKESFIHLFFPNSCPVCGKLGTAGCEECLTSLVIPLIAKCHICGRPYPCSVHRCAFPVIAGNLHEGINRKIVLDIKYRNNAFLGRIMGRALAKKVKQFKNCLLVPVPLHRKSMRNYNQAELIAQGISEIWGNPVLDFLTWRSDMNSQIGKTQKERRNMPENAVKCLTSEVQGQEFLLVDDVSTTGSTLNVCSKAIFSSGGRVVGAITWTISAY